MRMQPTFAEPADFQDLKSDLVFLSPPAIVSKSSATASPAEQAVSRQMRSVRVTGASSHKQHVILELEGCDDMDLAEKLRGCQLFCLEEDLWEPPKGQYYEFQLVGCAVIEAASGTEIGTIARIIDGSSHDFIEVQTREQHTFLMPNVPQVVKNVDLATRQMHVELPPGLDKV